MIKPRKGYLICEVMKKEKVKGIYMPAEIEDDNSNKHIIVQSVGAGITDIKKGDNIVLSATANVNGAKDGDSDVLIIAGSDVAGVRKK